MKRGLIIRQLALNDGKEMVRARHPRKLARALSLAGEVNEGAGTKKGKKSKDNTYYR